MTSQPDRPPASNRNTIILMIVSIYLIATFLWRLFTPAHEYPMRAEQVMEMGIDLLMLVGVIGLTIQVPSGKLLGWIGVAAGVGLFVIRMTSDASWWTGHLVYYIEPR
jgi:hypothetical protein